MLERPGLIIKALVSQKHVENVLGVVGLHLCHAPVDGDALFGMGEQPDRIQAHVHLLELLTLLGLLIDEAAGLEARQARLNEGLFRMHALHLKGLVSFEKTLNMLVFRCGVEKGPVHVLGQTGESLPEPLLIVGARLVKALGPGEVDGGKPSRVWLLLGGVDEVSWCLYIWKRMNLFSCIHLYRTMPFAQWILLVLGTAEGVLIADIHFREGHGVGDSLEDSGLPPPEPVSVNVKGFVYRPDL